MSDDRPQIPTPRQPTSFTHLEVLLPYGNISFVDGSIRENSYWSFLQIYLSPVPTYARETASARHLQIIKADVAQAFDRYLEEFNEDPDRHVPTRIVALYVPIDEFEDLPYWEDYLRRDYIRTEIELTERGLR